MAEEYSVPFPQSYWVVPGKLLAGRYPGSQDPTEHEEKLRALVDCGISRVINLMEPNEVNYQGEPFVPYDERMRQLAAPSGREVIMQRYSIRDVSIPTREQMRTILNDIDASLANGDVIYVHCWGGKGRTGTVIGCYLARHNIATGSQALKHLTDLRKRVRPLGSSPETREQCRMVKSWQAGE